MPPEAPTLLMGPGNSWGAAPQCALVPPPRPGLWPARPAQATLSRWYHKAIPNLGCSGTNSPSRPLPRGHTPQSLTRKTLHPCPRGGQLLRASCPLFFFFFPRRGRESQPGRLRPGQGRVRRRTPETAPSPISSAPSFLLSSAPSPSQERPTSALLCDLGHFTDAL